MLNCFCTLLKKQRKNLAKIFFRWIFHSIVDCKLKGNKKDEETFITNDVAYYDSTKNRNYYYYFSRCFYH